MKHLQLNEVQGPVKPEPVSTPVTPHFAINNPSPTPSLKSYINNSSYHIADQPLPQPEYEPYVDQYIPIQQTIHANTADFTTDPNYYDPSYYTYTATVNDANTLRPTFSASSNSCSSSEGEAQIPTHNISLTDGTILHSNPHHYHTENHHQNHHTPEHQHFTLNCYNESPGGPPDQHHPNNVVTHEFTSVIVEAPTSYHMHHDEFVH